MIDCTKLQTYWIVFKPGQGWFAKFLNKEIGHCFILTQDGFNWYSVDPTRPKLIIEILSYSPTFNLPHHLRTKTNLKIIQLTMYQKPRDYIVHTLNFFTCTTIVKYILGLKIVAFTPWQLYKRLHRLRRHPKKQIKFGIHSIIFLF